MQLKVIEYSKAQDLTESQQDKKHNNINPLVTQILEHFNFNLTLIKTLIYLEVQKEKRMENTRHEK